MEIVAQGLGILAFIASVVSFQMKSYRQILWVQILCAGLFTAHFLLLMTCGHPDAVTGGVLNGICMVRDVVLLVTEKTRKEKGTWILAIVFSVIVVVTGIATWSSWVSVLFIIAMVLNTIALSIPDPATVRLIIMCSGPFALAYDLLTQSIGGSINEVVSFISALTAYLRYKKAQT